MAITDVSVVLHTRDVPKSTKYGGHAAGGSIAKIGVLSVQTDDGVMGNALLGVAGQSAEGLTDQLLARLKPIIMGRNPLDIGAIWADMWKLNRMVDARAIGAVDIALWDIAGKVANLPIHRLLGTCREKVPVYAASARMHNIEDYVEEALHFRNLGWHAYKIHPFGEPKRDIALCGAVQQAVGDSMELMLDSFQAYTYIGALRVGQAIQEMGYYWYEDPLPRDDIYNYVKLKQHLSIRLLATETTTGSLYNYTPWITEKATDMLRGDVAIKGGITPMLKICHLAEAFGMNCEIHDAFTSIDHVANLHVAMAVPNSEFLEVLQPPYIRDYGLVSYPEIDREGYIHAPTKPGLGFEIDWELVNRTKTAELR